MSNFATPTSQTCPQCGAELRLVRREPAPFSPTIERLYFECTKCTHTAAKMQPVQAKAS